MARIRSIKPDYWTDEKVVELSFPARLLFIGLWNFADDDGRMVYSPKRIKMQVFPADSVDVSELVGEIQRNGMVQVYVVDGVEYLQINNFAKHQKIDKRSASKFPVPPNPSEFPRVPPNPAESHRIPPTEGNGRDQGREGIKEGKEKTPVAPLALPAWLDEGQWKSYVKTRPSAARKPDSLKAALEKLEKFREEGFDPNAIVAESLANGWRMLKAPEARRPGSTPDYSAVIANLKD